MYSILLGKFQKSQNLKNCVDNNNIATGIFNSAKCIFCHLFPRVLYSKIVSTDSHLHENDRLVVVFPAFLHCWLV